MCRRGVLRRKRDFWSVAAVFFRVAHNRVKVALRKSEPIVRSRIQKKSDALDCSIDRLQSASENGLIPCLIPLHKRGPGR